MSAKYDFVMEGGTPKKNWVGEKVLDVFFIEWLSVVCPCHIVVFYCFLKK